MGPDPEFEKLELALYAVAVAMMAIFFAVRWLLGWQ